MGCIAFMLIFVIWLVTKNWLAVDANIFNFQELSDDLNKFHKQNIKCILILLNTFD